MDNLGPRSSIKQSLCYFNLNADTQLFHSYFNFNADTLIQTKVFLTFIRGGATHYPGSRATTEQATRPSVSF